MRTERCAYFFIIRAYYITTKERELVAIFPLANVKTTIQEQNTNNNEMKSLSKDNSLLLV